MLLLSRQQQRRCLFADALFLCGTGVALIVALPFGMRAYLMASALLQFLVLLVTLKWLFKIAAIARNGLVSAFLPAVTASLTGPFYRVPEVHGRVEDRRNGVFVDLLPAGKVLKRGCRVPFPQPGKVVEELQIVKLEELISLKLDSAANSPLRRLKDKTDVVELIIRGKLPRDLAVAPAVRDLYLETWDGLQNEV